MSELRSAHAVSPGDLFGDINSAELRTLVGKLRSARAKFAWRANCYAIGDPWADEASRCVVEIGRLGADAGQELNTRKDWI